MARIDEPGDWQRVDDRRKGLSPRRRRAAAIALVAVVFVGIWVWWGSVSSGVELTRDSDAAEEPRDPDVVEDAEVAVGESDDEAPASEGGDVGEPVPATVKVHVDGAVLVPGVYEVYGEDPRVADAVSMAGGLSDEADTSAVNLAARLADGDKVHIPRVEEDAEPVQGVGEIPAGSSTTPNASASSGEPATGSQGGQSGPININTASAEELTALPGVGEKTAEKIVADREAMGPFASPEDLMRVPGIGEKKFAQVRDLICV